VLVIIDAEPKDHNIGLPTEAYIAVEEVHDVSIICLLLFSSGGYLCFSYIDLYSSHKFCVLSIIPIITYNAQGVS